MLISSFKLGERWEGRGQRLIKLSAMPLATPPSSGEVSPKEKSLKQGGAATVDAAPGAGSYLHLGASPSLLPPMEDKLMHALDEYLAHSPSPEL